MSDLTFVPRRATLLSALAVQIALAANASAQSQEILGRDNTQFAQALFDRGHLELAEGVCASIEAADKAGSADAYEVIDVKFLRTKLRFARAIGEPDVNARMTQLDAAKQEMLGLIDEYPRTTAASDARNMLPDYSREYGEAVTAAIQAQSDAAQVAELRAKGQQAFSEAEDELNARKERFSEERQDPVNPNFQKADSQYLLSSYNLARTYYFNALLYPQDDPKRKTYLQQGRDAFQDLGLEYADQLLTYQGMVYEGLCSKELGKTKEALEAFDGAIALRETFEKNDNGQYDVPTDSADIVCSGVLQKVLLLTEKDKAQDAVAAAKDYFETIPDAMFAQNALAVLAAQAEAELALHDIDAASASAQKLLEIDKEGPWGATGRELLGRMMSASGSGVALAPRQLLKVAENLAYRGDVAQVAQIGETARQLAKGTPEEADIGAESWMLTGVTQYNLGRLHEASLAFDLAQENYPKGAQAAEALSRASKVYQVLNSQERTPFLRKRYEDRLRKLASDYPEHPDAASAQFIEGQALEDEQDFLKAAEVYRRVQPGSKSYEEGKFKAANCLFRHARELIRQKKVDQAKPFLAESEQLLKQNLTDIPAALQKNLDPDVQRKLRGYSFASRATLAQIYLLQDVGRASEVSDLLSGMDEEFASDPSKISELWSLRIQALNALGKLDEAVATLDALRLKDPEGSGLSAAAGVLARALDQAAVALIEKEPTSAKADEMLKTASQYYLLSIAPQLQGKEPLRPDAVEVVATRLYVFGMRFNGVPDNCATFVGWEGGPAKDTQYWEKSKELYEAMYSVNPSYKWLVGIGRNLGFLGRWKDAAEVYARVFNQENLIDRSTQRFDSAVLASKPLLVFAYMEWGAAEQMVAIADKEPKEGERYRRAYEIFEKVVDNTQDDNSLWWQAQYYKTRSLFERGIYDQADFMVRNLERKTDDFDKGKFGYKEKFLAIKKDLAKKVFPSSPTPTPPKPKTDEPKPKKNG
jgi:hypothetical protein